MSSKAVISLVLITLVFVGGCKKTDDKKTDNEGVPNEVIKPVEPNSVTPVTVTPSGMAPIEIVLPHALFEGTPQNIKVPNLEAPRPAGKKRDVIFAPIGTKNLALHKAVTGSDTEPILGSLDMITDGDKEATDGSFIELGPGTQWVMIDLGAECNIYAMCVWHYHKQPWVYYDVVVESAKDKDFLEGVATLFNNDTDNSSGRGVGKDKHYTETNEGRLIDAKGVRGRYVRLFSKGNSSNDLNNYIEVEVYGKPIE